MNTSRQSESLSSISIELSLSFPLLIYQVVYVSPINYDEDELLDDELLLGD